MSADNPEPFLCVAGMERSGTTWLARLLADAFNQPCYSRARRFGPERDPVVHGLDREGAGVFRGHWTVRTYPYKAPVVLIVRDPRAQALSSYHFYNKKDLGTHARWVVSKAPRGSSWSEYITEWLARDVVVTRYESLHQDAYGELYGIIRALKLPSEHLPPVDHLRKVVHDNDFRVMQERRTAHRLMRRGLTDEWRNVMSPETVAHINRACSPLMQTLGYS
jgi:hypothetical protein